MLGVVRKNITDTINEIRADKGVKCIFVAFISGDVFYCDNRNKQDPQTGRCRRDACDLWGSWKFNEDKEE
jgi:hypothetical protein